MKLKEYYTFHKRSRLTVTDVPFDEPVALRTFIDLPTIQWAMPQVEKRWTELIGITKKYLTHLGQFNQFSERLKT